MNTAAIYTRKSKFTGTGESIQNQVQICKDYLSRSSDQYNYLVYEDEGFSGKNIERPQFKKMLRDAKVKNFKVLICYRLDRISRNIADFANLMQELEKYGISFISVNEQFDTSSPMGRAMMYIASVFAQLERETIAERVRDNMLELAKDGRWLGGRTPTGYESTHITILDEEMKEHKMFQLSPIKEELELVRLIFNKYLEYRSLSQVTKFLLTKNIKTKLDTDWTNGKVRNILVSPVYVKASEETIKYLNAHGIITAGTPDGIHGMISYNKKKSKSGPYRESSEWVYAVGNHEGIIDSWDWIRVQDILKANHAKAPRTGKSHTALLSGIIRCAKCGSLMKVAYGEKVKSTGLKPYYYACSMKHRSGTTRCDNRNIRGDTADDMVINELKFISSDKKRLVEELKNLKTQLSKELDDSYDVEKIKESLRKNKLAIENLLNTLSLTEDKSTSKLLLDKIQKLSEENKTLEENLIKSTSLKEVKDEQIKNFEIPVEALKSFKDTIEQCTMEEKRALLASIVDKVYWDGDNQILDVRLWGINKK
jgi:site-specific DNA recombinase